MPALCVAVALLVQSAPEPGAWHPADATLYFEVPDLPDVVDAYEDTAVARMLADEEIRALLGAWLGVLPAPGSWFEELVEQAAESLDLVGLDGALLARARSLSLSITARLADATAQEAALRGRMALVAGLVERHAAAAGALPATLDELEGAQRLGPLLELDPWGRPWVFAPREDGGFELGCLGGDGEPGGAAELLHDAALVASGPYFGAVDLHPRLALTLADEADAEAFVEAAAMLAESRALALTRRGATVLLGGGESIADPLDALLSGELPSVATSRRLAREQASFGKRRGAIVFQASTHLGEELLELDRISGGDPYGERIPGLKSPPAELMSKSASYRMQLADGVFVTEGFQPRGKDERALFGGRALGRDALDLLPPDARFASVVRLDAQVLADIVGAVLRAGGLGDEASLAAFEAQHGFRPDRDLLEPLGTEAAIAVLPIETFLEAPDLRLAVRLEDPERFRRGVNGVVAAARAAMGSRLRVNGAEYQGALWIAFSLTWSAIDELWAERGFDPIALLEPTVAVLEDRLLLTLSPPHAKQEIRRLAGRGRGRSSAEPPTFPRESRGAVQLGFADWAQLLAGLYDSARELAPLLAEDGVEIPFDLAALPEPEPFLRFLPPGQHWMRQVKGGTLYHSRSSLGPEGLLAFVVGIVRLASAFDEPEIPSAAEPPLEERDLDAQTRASLARLRVAIDLHRADQGSLPAALADLARGTAGFPEGFLAGDPVPVDGWGRAFHYAPSADGYRLWSAGPDGIDQGGAGDDLELS